MDRAVRVLVIEDNPDDALIIERALRRTGFQVEFAATGADGIKMGLREETDLIILDYRLGDMTGTDVLLRIREKRATVPVIMASGMGSHFIVARAIALGAAGFVSKDDPAFAEKLTSMIESVVAQHGGVAKTPLPDRSSVQSRAQEVKRMISTLLESTDLIATVGIVGPDGALISSAVQDRTGAQDVTAVLAGTVQTMMGSVANHLGFGKPRFHVFTFEKGSVAMAPLPGGLTFFVTSPAHAEDMERLRKEIETAAMELATVMGPQPKATKSK